MTQPLTRVLGSALLVLALGCGQRSGPTELQRASSGDLDVVLLSSDDTIKHGIDDFVLEFRSKAGGALVDVGTVAVTANMPMPGMQMFGKIDVKPTDTPGRYAATAQLEMAGTWGMTVKWLGSSAGAGSVSFSRSIQ